MEVGGWLWCQTSCAQCNHTDVKAVLDKKLFADRCVWERYDDVHGWTGARLDLGDAAQVARAEQAYAVVAKFFAANLH